ncbi:MAG: hypothetical protein DSO04_02590 [Hadesarchaea archaeon]|nr:MAG: hypothetical protein DSO04_02590 [Hadesarchaea archaeon]
MDSRGVSPMIATIVLIAIVFAVAAILALSLASAPQPSVIFGGQLSLENVESGRTVIVIKHTYGDRANDAVTVRLSENGLITQFAWKNLEMRVNGATSGITIQKVISGGTSYALNDNGLQKGLADNTNLSLVGGDQIQVHLTNPLTIGAKVSLKWVPKNQTLIEREVNY